MEKLGPGDGIAGELVHRRQCRRRVGRAAAESGPDRDPLGERQVDAERAADHLERRARRPDGEVLLHRPGFGAVHLERDPAPVPPFGSELVGQLEPAEERLDPVVAAFFPGEHPEQQVHLGAGRNGGGVAHGRAPAASRRCRPVRASDQRPSRVTGMKVVMW